jgi:energy-coupling factor transporter transmembrane protein EcfT
LLQVSDFFERYALIPVGSVVLVFGLIITFLQKWPLFGFLQVSPSNWLLVSFILFVGGSLAIIPLRLVVRSKERTRAVEEALAQGIITPELTAAPNDKVVIRFRTVELVVLVVIIIFMEKTKSHTLFCRYFAQSLAFIK